MKFISNFCNFVVYQSLKNIFRNLGISLPVLFVFLQGSDLDVAQRALAMAPNFFVENYLRRKIFSSKTKKMKSSWSKDIFVEKYFRRKLISSKNIFVENLLSPKVFSTKGVFDEVNFRRKNSVPARQLVSLESL